MLPVTVGIVIAILGGIQCFGPLNSYGSIISIATGSIVATSSLIAYIIIEIKKYSNYQRGLQNVRWFCDNDLTRKKLAGFIQNNELPRERGHAFVPAPHEKFVLLITVIPQSIQDWSLEDTVAAQITQKYQREIGNRFLVLF